MKTIVANWKMQLGIRESVALAKATLLYVRGKKHIPEIVLCPSFVSFHDLKKMIVNKSLHLGSQDVSSKPNGMFTGDVCAKMLKESGVSHVLIGHSERRVFSTDTNEKISLKIQSALEESLIPILCVGETKEERLNGKMEIVLKTQLRSALQNVVLKKDKSFYVAYEPVWAIGSGETPLVDEIVKTHMLIREILLEIFPLFQKDQFIILYGGSVNDQNAYSLLRESEINGVLVGSASVKLHQWTSIIDSAMSVLDQQEEII